MTKVRYWDIEDVLQFLRNPEILYHPLSLFAEMPVKVQRLLGIGAEHLEIVFCLMLLGTPLTQYDSNIPRRLMTPSLHAWKRINRSFTSIRSAVMFSSLSRSSK